MSLFRLSLQGAAVAFLAAVGSFTHVSAADKIKVMFINEFPTQTIDLYWQNPSFEDNHPGRRKFEARIPPRGGFHSTDTFVGHEFSYDVDGQRHYVNPPPGNNNDEQYLILAGQSEGYRVRCEITVKSQQSMDYVDIVVKPYWAPRAAARFLELVRSKYYDGVAFNRVVPNLLTQFGIAKDFPTREKEKLVRMWDDFPKQIKFEPGTLSFSGTGHDSRTTEIFVVMPGVSKKQLEKFGENSWETPFATIDGDVNKSALNDVYSGYGDMPPFAKGPVSAKIYAADGYTTYLPRKFPQLDYINNCHIVDEVGISDELSNGEF